MHWTLGKTWWIVLNLKLFILNKDIHKFYFHLFIPLLIGKIDFLIYFA